VGEIKKKTFIEAHRGTLSGEGNLYDLGKIKTSLLREFYQASCGIEKIVFEVREKEFCNEIGGER